MSDFLNFSIKTRDQFKNWILRQLGFPVITPELKDVNLEDCINDAVEEFTEYAAQDQRYFGLNIKDYISSTGYYLPPDVQAVSNLYDYGINGCTNSGSNINPFSYNYMMINGGFVPTLNTRLGGSGWFDYNLVMQWLDLTYQMTGKGFEWNYNPRTKLLVLDPDPTKYFRDQLTVENYEGYFIVVECWCLRPEEQQYGEVWVKKMALAKAKTYIGNLRTTYDGINLPGGAKINGERILQQGLDEQTKLRDELLERFPVFGIYQG